MFNHIKFGIYYIQIYLNMNHLINKLVYFLILICLFATPTKNQCEVCYVQAENTNCQQDKNNITSYTLHMAVHPHLDAFWIFDFQSYYNPSPTQGDVMGYFAQNRFHSVKQIFDTTLDVLTKSKILRQTQGPSTQKAHRTFFNSEMGFFKRWYLQQPTQKRQKVKQILKTKYWEILGGAFVEHDQGCAYYDDIIQNFQVGLRFLKQQFQYYPRAAISADSFGHSQSTLAILAHLGVQGFFVQRSDEHILLQNKTQFIWKAKSANGHYYGALPTHIRWAIHGFEDQFIGGGNSQQKFCQTKTMYIDNMNRENQFLKRILKSNHIMRYFGHDFQQFDDYSYRVMEGFMEKFSMQKCNRVSAVYGNPSQYFVILMSEVFGKTKPVAVRQEDIMPIWDYDSGLYWTGYYTTDQFHKKNYRDAGRYLYAARKMFTPLYISDSHSDSHKDSYKLLEQFSQTVAYLQHHDGISGTSKYQVMDKYESVSNAQIQKIKDKVFQEVFEVSYPVNSNSQIFYCSLDNQCDIPEQVQNDIYLKVFKTGGCPETEPIIVHLNSNQYFEPDCKYQVNCMCTSFPCGCDLYLYPKIGTYGLIKLKKVDNKWKQTNFLHVLHTQGQVRQFKFNNTHIVITYNNKQYNIGYKRLNGDPTSRSYDHLSRYGEQVPRVFQIRSGKYALGNNIKTKQNLSKIRKVLILESNSLKKYVILWGRQQMKTVITIPKQKPNQWKIQTYSSAESGKLEDLYLQINAPHINNEKKFYVDSNGWLVMKRQLFYHQDYKAFFCKEGYDDIDGNSYPMTAFVYIQDEKTGQNKMSVNTDRPQGVIAYQPGTIWINYDRLSSDDGKWVYENTFRSQYQKFVHYVTVQNTDNNQRRIQKIYDEPLVIQGNSVSSNQRVSNQGFQYSEKRQEWQDKTNINNVKFTVKAWNDSSLLLRIQNLNDSSTNNFSLFSESDKTITFLTAYYGNQIKFQKVYETNLGGNIAYQNFLQKKWNWNNIINLQKENQIFDKIFAQSMFLRPLEIRTFVFQGVSMDTQTCRQLKDIKYSSQTKSYTMDISKPMPFRSDSLKLNEIRINDYLLNQNHCKNQSPVQIPDSSMTPQVTLPNQDFLVTASTNKQNWQAPKQNKQNKQYKQHQKPKKQETNKKQVQVKKPQLNRQKQKKEEPDRPAQVHKQQKSESYKIKQKVEAMQVLSKQQKQTYFKDKAQYIYQQLKVKRTALR